MADGNDKIQPASALGDAVEEFKKLPLWGKIFVGVLAAGVVYVIISAISNKGSSNPSAGLTQGSLAPTDNSAGSQSPFSNVSSNGSSVPLLPSDVNPVYNSQGGLVAYQQGASTPSNTTSSSTTSSNPVAAVAGYLGLLGPNVQVNFQNRTYKNSQGQWVPLPISSSAKLVQGSQNRVWYVDGGGQHLLTSGNGPAIDPTTNQPASSTSSSPAVTNQQNTSVQQTTNKATGEGSVSWQSYLRELFGSHEYVPQYGDNMNEVASKLGLKGGWKAFQFPDFTHGQAVPVPNQATQQVPNISNDHGILSMHTMGYSLQQSNGSQSLSGPNGLSISQGPNGQSIAAPNGFSLQQNQQGQTVSGPNGFSLQQGPKGQSFQNGKPA